MSHWHRNPKLNLRWQKAVRVTERFWPAGVLRFKSLRLYSLSASLTSLAWRLQSGACSTCCRFLSCLGSRLSSVTSSTIRATMGPNAASSSASEVSVSSTVSWSTAACRGGGADQWRRKKRQSSMFKKNLVLTCRTSMSVTPPSWLRILATPEKFEISRDKCTINTRTQLGNMDF